MKKFLLKIFLLAIITLVVSSCRTVTPKTDYKALAKASIKLGVNIDLSDNHKLYIAAAEWIGTPYRSGGTSKRGVDCSGFVTQLYNDVYRIRLSRTSQEQYNNCRRVRKGVLREGDLVFFTTQQSGKQVAHAGVYLKQGKFIHAILLRVLSSVA